MIGVIKKIVLSSVSILGISLIFWIVFLLNPNLSYANETQFDNILIYHNADLEKETQSVIQHALSIIEKADIYDKDINIELCLNDDKIYPHLYPFAGGTVYALFNKTVIYASTPSFNNNTAEFTWSVNNNELRKYNLTTLLAHEFMHNLQNNHNTNYYITSTLGKINWKFEGHAEYYSRAFKDDSRLKEKIDFYLTEETKEHTGVPVFKLENGTIQNLSYFKYALVIQYLYEEKNLNFDEICALENGLDDLYEEMINWKKNRKD